LNERANEPSEGFEIVYQKNAHKCRTETGAFHYLSFADDINSD
jgi:hypothetical protein